MMKQPAENMNATREEAIAAAQRAEPPGAEPEHDEIAAVARQLWLDRGGGEGGSPEQDWFRAVEIVRKRRAAVFGNPIAAGNRSTPNESYVLSAGGTRTHGSNALKEHTHMENTSGTTQNTGTGMMENVRETADRARQSVQQYMQDEPQSFPRPEHREGRIARSIEQQTARIPSDAWLWAAVGSMGLSLALELSGKDKTANFVGHWAPTLLIFGLYNKMVKLQGSDGL